MKGANIRFLNNRVMDELGAGDIQAGIQDVKRVYSIFSDTKETGAHKLTIPDKVVLRFGKTQEDEHSNGRINAMPGRVHDGELDIAGIKWIGSGAKNADYGYPRASALVILNHPTTKLPMCIADGTRISATRTGAAGGVAVELLSRQASSVLTICGAGAQGRTQLEAALISRPGIKTVNVYDKYDSSAARYIQDCQAKYPSVVFAQMTLETLGNAVSQSDIVITATTADHPFIKAQWVTPGTLLINMAADEMERECILMSDKTVVDFWESVQHRNSSSIAHMVNDPDGGYQNFHPTAELGEILNHKKPGREHDDEIIYFNAVGAGVLDMMIVHRCYTKAEQQNKGELLVYWEGDET